MLELLQQVFRQVRGYMHSDAFNRKGVYSSSAEHTTMQFDREAEDIILSGLIDSRHGLETTPEARPPITPRAAPHYRIVIHPVDVSTNALRGLITPSVALAVLWIHVL